MDTLAQKQPMDIEQVERLLAREISDALDYINGSDSVAGERQRNLEYYCGIMTDLPTSKGRSSVVDMTVSEYVNLIIPSLMRVFVTSKTVAEYTAQGDNAEALLKDMTRYVNDVVLKQDNSFEQICYGWGFDALVQKVGVVAAFWEPKTEYEADMITGLTDDGFALWSSENPDVEILAHEGTRTIDGMTGIVTANHTVQFRREINKSAVRVVNIPPEEFVISRNSRGPDDFVVKSHRTPQKVGDLLKEGYDPAIIDELPNYQPIYSSQTAQDINNQSTYNRQPASNADPELREVAIHKGIVRCDPDMKGLRDWYFVAGGSENRVRLLRFEEYKCQVVFADFCPNPIPHTFWGRCPADDLAENQKIQTVLKRQMLDNIYLNNTPQREVVQDWIVKPDQLLNYAPGAPVLVKQPGAIREISVPFMAEKALTVMQYVDSTSELRAGVSRQSMGLDPQALTNQSATAANIMQSAAQGKVENYARIWATNGMRKLFRGIMDILIEYQDFARVVSVNSAEKQVNPQEWRNLRHVDVTINTGLGTGTRERDFAMLEVISETQDDIMETLGPDNPIASYRQWILAKHKQIEAAGLSNPEQYISLPPIDWKWPQPPPPQPDPNTVVLANVEAGKTQARLIESKAKIDADKEIEAEKILADNLQVLAQEETKRQAQSVDGQVAQTKHIELLTRIAANEAKETEATTAAASSNAQAGAQQSMADMVGELAKAVQTLQGEMKRFNKPRVIEKDAKTGRKRAVIAEDD